MSTLSSDKTKNAGGSAAEDRRRALQGEARDAALRKRIEQDRLDAEIARVKQMQVARVARSIAPTYPPYPGGHTERARDARVDAGTGGGGSWGTGSGGGGRGTGGQTGSGYISDREGWRERTRPARTTRAGDSFLSQAALDRARADGRYLMRTSLTVAGMVRRDAAMMIGLGLKLQCKTGDREWDRAAEALFARWGNSCDARGKMRFARMERLGYRQTRVDGDLLFVKIAGSGEIESPGDMGKLQPVDGARLVSPTGQAAAKLSPQQRKMIHAGVEVDAAGKVTAYWIAPYASAGGWVKSAEAVRVPASEVLFLSNYADLTQSRGEPSLCRLPDVAEHLDGFIEATSIAARMQAAQTIVHKRAQPGIAQGQLPGETITNSDGSTEQRFDVEPGAVWTVGQDDGVEMVGTNAPGPNFPDGSRAMTRYLSAEMDMPLELGNIDTSQSTAYAGRTGLNIYHECGKTRVQDFIDDFHRPLYYWIVGLAMAAGLLPYNPNWRNHQWLPPGRMLHEPKVEAEGAVVMVNNRIMSRRRWCAERGIDYDEMLEEMAAEEAELAEYGLRPVHAPGTADAGGVGGGAGAGGGGAESGGGGNGNNTGAQA